MKQKEKNSIIIGFLLSAGIILFFVVYMLIYIYPNIVSINENKNTLQEQLTKHNLILSKGFNFTDFKILNSKYSSSSEDKELKDILDDGFYKKIYKDLDKDFYDKLVYNGSYVTFENRENFGEYLDSKITSLNDIIESKELNDKIIKINTVLPKYSELIDLNTKTGLSDLTFINNIEILLKQFNLKVEGKIGIKNVLAIEDGVIDPDDNVFFIPLDLELTGTKSSILNFLQYVSNTGDIEFSENDFTFTDKLGAVSQLTEVVSFETMEYIDSSYRERTTLDESLDRFLLKTNQSNDIIDARVSLRFYISGVSSEKIIEKINSIIGTNNKQILFDEDGNYIIDEETGEYKYELIHYNYNNLLSVAKKLNSSPILNKNTYYKNKINNIYAYLTNTELISDIKNIKLEMNKIEDLDPTYKQVIKYKEIFTKLDLEMYEASKALGLDKDEKDDSGKIIKKGIYPENYYF